MKSASAASSRPTLRRLLVALCVLGATASAVPALAKGGEPRLLVTAGPIRELQGEREALRARLTKLDFLLSDALRRARRPELQERLGDARDLVTDARRMLGFVAPPSGAGGVAYERDEGARPGDPRVEAVYTNRVLVVELSSVQRELSMAERILAEIEDERRHPGGRGMLGEARGELLASLNLLASLFAPIQAPPPRPPTQHSEPNQPWPMAERPFQNLLSTLAGQSWADDRLRTLESAAQANWFLVAQVEQLLTRFDFSQHKLQAMRILKPRILDPQNSFQLYGAFPYAADKQELGRILADPTHAAVPVAQPQPIVAQELDRLIRRVTSSPTAEAWFQSLEREAPAHWFTVAQASSVANPFPTPDARLRALSILKPRLLDPQNWPQFEPLFPPQGYRSRLADLFRR